VGEPLAVVNLTIEGDDEGAITANQGLLALGPPPDRGAPDSDEDVSPLDAAFPVRAPMGQPTKRGRVAPRIRVDPGPATDGDDATHGQRVRCD
jgi:hypothetical protein